uniref:Uncharacterized protein n=1 Tax=Mus spicilegus TaxID=10103 RepID=A0A8C6G7L7_MUSSI
MLLTISCLNMRKLISSKCINSYFSFYIIELFWALISEIALKQYTCMQHMPAEPLLFERCGIRKNGKPGVGVGGE